MPERMDLDEFRRRAGKSKAARRKTRRGTAKYADFQQDAARKAKKRNARKRCGQDDAEYGRLYHEMVEATRRMREHRESHKP